MTFIWVIMQSIYTVHLQDPVAPVYYRKRATLRMLNVNSVLLLSLTAHTMYRKESWA